VNNYALLKVVMKARLEYPGWCVKPRGSNVYGKIVEESTKKRKLLEEAGAGNGRTITLDAVSYKQVQDLWRVEEKEFDKFCDLFELNQRNLPRARRVATIFEWRGPVKCREANLGTRQRDFTAQEKRFLTMTPEATV